jgi:hypothetical protein
VAVKDGDAGVQHAVTNKVDATNSANKATNDLCITSTFAHSSTITSYGSAGTTSKL